jgi:rhodanese-related sulfurtransferase
MAKTYSDLIAEARDSVKIVQLQEVHRRLEQKEPMVLVDVREKEEFRAGFIPGAISLPRGWFEQQFEAKLPDKNAPIVVYSAGGTRSVFVAKQLQEYGYTRIESANPGFTRWKDLRFPVEIPPSLTDAQRERYSRHILLPEVGEAGQAKLLGSKVLLLGAGAGSPAALYAAAGVGTLGIVDAIPSMRRTSSGDPAPRAAWGCRR